MVEHTVDVIMEHPACFILSHVRPNFRHDSLDFGGKSGLVPAGNSAGDTAGTRAATSASQGLVTS